MPGPIETAFVDIIATLKFDGDTNQLTEGIRREVKKAQGEFDKLENVAADTARSITSKLSSVRVDVNVRDAIGGVKRLGDAVEATVADLRVLSGKSVDLGTAEVRRNIDNLERSFARLSSQFKTVDGETLTINVSTAELRIKEISVNVQKLLNNLNEAARKNVNLDVAPAIAALRLVGERATVALRQVRAIGTDKVTVRIEDLGLDSLEAKLHAAAAEISEVSGKPIHIDTRPAIAEVGSLEQRTKSFGDTFERVGKRLLAFAVFGGITAGLSQLVSAGVQAAAQIETIEVSLDRLFKGFEAAGRQLGGTSSEFLANLKQIAVTTPFQFADLGAVSTKLIQLDTNLNKVADSTGKIPSRAEVAIGRMRELADAAAGVGATADDINGVVKAISQLAAKGKINLQDLNQIAERLPNFQRQLQIESIIEQLNKVRPELHATVADFDTLRAKGLIPVNVAVDGLFEGLKKIPGAAGAAAAQARTLTGALSNLKDFATLEFAKAFTGAGATLADSLNAAFTKTDIKTPLSKAIAEVISAAGIATQKALPGVLAFVTKIADKIADGVTAMGNLVESLASGFGGNVFSGMVVGLTDVVNLLTAVNQILSHLPAAVGEGIGQFLVLSTVLGQITAGKINVLGLVGDQIKAIGVAAVQVAEGLLLMSGAEEAAAAGALQLRAGLQALATSTAILAAITAAFIAVQTFLNQNAKAARWSKEFQEAINSATTSLKNFNDVGSATEDFIKQFADNANKIKLGDLSGLLDGRTTTQLETNLGLTQAKLAELVDVMAEFGPNSKEAGAELAKLGVNFDTLKASLGEKELATTVANLQSLSDQFAKGAPAAFDAAVAQKTFNFVTDDTTASIVKATKASGDYINGLKMLQAANNTGAAAEFKAIAAVNNVSDARQRALLKDATSTDAAGASTIDYTKAVAGLREQIQNLNDTFLDVLDKAPAVGESFRRLTGDTGSAQSKMLDFAKAVDEAGLSASELDAIGQKLGTSLTGEQLSKALTTIATDFKDTLETLKSSLPTFSDAVNSAFGSIKIADGLTGIQAVQSAFNQFSLDKFITELNRVTDAKINLVTNLNKLADLSTEAVRRLFELKLDPTQLAVATQALNDGGQQVIDAFLAPFQASDALIKTSGTELVNKLVEAGIDPALLAAIPGLTGSVQGAINTALSDVQPDIDKLQALKLTVDPKLRGEISQDIADLKAARTELSAQTTQATIDTAAAVQQATDAGTQVANAFGTSVNAGLNSSLQSATTTIALSLGGLGSLLSLPAFAAGSSVGGDFVNGFANAIGNLATNPLITGNGSLAGQVVGAAFLDGLHTQLEIGVANIFGAALQKVLDNLPPVNDMFRTAGIGLSDALTGGVGENIDDALNEIVVGALTNVLQEVNAQGIFFDGSGAHLGFQLMEGMAKAINGVQVATTLHTLLNTLSSLLASPAYNAGLAIGENLGLGLIAGLNFEQTAARAAGGAIVDAAEQGAREHSKAHSPSLLFAELGKDLGDGIALGITRSTSGIVRAMTAAMSAFASFSQPSLPSGQMSQPGSSSSPVAATAAAVVGSSTVHNNTWNLNVPTDNPEAFARKAMDTLERRLSR